MPTCSAPCLPPSRETPPPGSVAGPVPRRAWRASPRCWAASRRHRHPRGNPWPRRARPERGAMPPRCPSRAWRPRLFPARPGRCRAAPPSSLIPCRDRASGSPAPAPASPRERREQRPRQPRPCRPAMAPGTPRPMPRVARPRVRIALLRRQRPKVRPVPHRPRQGKPSRQRKPPSPLAAPRPGRHPLSRRPTRNPARPGTAFPRPESWMPCLRPRPRSRPRRWHRPQPLWSLWRRPRPALWRQAPRPGLPRPPGKPPARHRVPSAPRVRHRPERLLFPPPRIGPPPTGPWRKRRVRGTRTPQSGTSPRTRGMRRPRPAATRPPPRVPRRWR
ncbi:hypothetical protein ROMU108268_00680 [Roseomonas mucosa]